MNQHKGSRLPKFLCCDTNISFVFFIQISEDFILLTSDVFLSLIVTILIFSFLIQLYKCLKYQPVNLLQFLDVF